ncbi:MAG: MAPEG family protein [Pseudomonadota bacterium]
MIESVTPPVFTAVLGGTLLPLQTTMMLAVGMYRSRSQQSIGIAGDATLERLVRRHGNLAENAAIFLVVLALFELLFGASAFVWGIGLVFLVARLLHIIGFSNETGSHLANPTGAGKIFILFRVCGALLTALSTIVLGVTLVVSVFLTF